MKDRLNPCIYYTCAHGECEKHIKDVTLARCKNCTKYRGRKTTKKMEPISHRREKDKQRSERRLKEN